MRSASWDMEFKRVRGERECGVESIDLVCWGVIGEGPETEVDTVQNDVGLVQIGRGGGGSPGRGRESTQRRKEHGRCKRGIC